MKEKLKTTSFWLGVGSAIVVIVDSIGELFGFGIASQEISNIFVSICSVLVLLGIVTKKSTTDTTDSSQEELLTEIKNSQDNNLE